MAEDAVVTAPAATATAGATPPERKESSSNNNNKKKKTKRSTSSRKESALSASARSTGSRRGSGVEGLAGEEKRRRSRSTDKIKTRRDSGSRRTSSTTNGGGEPITPKEGWERKSGALRGSGRHNSPHRAGGTRRTKSETVEKTTKQQQAPQGDTSNSPKQPPIKDRSRSRSPTRSSGTTIEGHAPRLPQRTVSDSSDLQSALEATRNKQKEPIVKKDSFEEASLGDYKMYAATIAQKQQQRAATLGGSSLRIGSSPGRQKMGEIPEESLGSFTAFAKKYEDEKLLGLHDGDDGPDVYGQNSSKLQQQNSQPQHEKTSDVSMSLGNLVANPMEQYGGNNNNNNNNNKPTAKPNKPPVEESLGSFTAFHKTYEQDKLLGLNDSQSTPPPPPKDKKTPNIPEESMGDFVQLAAKEEQQQQASANNNNNEKSQQTTTNDSSGGLSMSKSGAKQRDKKQQQPHDNHHHHYQEEKESFLEVPLPKHRIEKLGKRGGVNYSIVVDSAGGHSPEPMKIVVAIEFEDDSSESSESEASEEEDPLDGIAPPISSATASAATTPPPEKEEYAADQAEEINESGHLPLSALDDDQQPTNKEKPLLHHHKKKKPITRIPEAAGKYHARQQQQTEEEEEDNSEAVDEVGPLEANVSRWNNQTAAPPKQPEREKSMHSHQSNSTHSTVSSVTLESALEAGITIQTDSMPSHQSQFPTKPAVQRGRGLNAALRRPSGAVPAGGTATLLKRPSMVAPHNLGTKRGLLLRQQSEASMMSTGTSKSNDSSWVSPNNEVPESYQASFMQLDLVNLGKTEMQTNEEVEQAELPEALRSGVEGIDASTPQQEAQPLGGELEAIPEGKDPKAAASELLGMKTMLKHIRRAAPKRSKSFEFDRDMPKQMWNKMFAKKGELPGSQYIDNDESTGREEDDNIESTRTAPPDAAFRGSNRSTDEAAPSGEFIKAMGESKSMTAGLFSTIKKVTVGTGTSTSSKPIESSGSKGKSSLWNSTIGSVIPSSKKSKPDEPVPEPTDNANDDASEASLELSGILQELDKSLAHHLDASGDGDDQAPGGRREDGEKGNEGSARGARSGRGGRRGGTARARAARAQHAHNRSLRDTVDYYTAEQEDDDLPQLDAMNEEEARKKQRVRRRKMPHRTKSDEGTGRIATRSKMGESSRGVHRTRSQDASPPRAMRDASKRMHASFSGLDPKDAPPIRRTRTQQDSSDVPPLRRLGTKSREGASGQQDSGDAPATKRQGTKSREGPAGKEAPHRTRSHDKAMRGSAGRKQRPQRKKSTGGIPEDPEGPGHKRGAELPKDATEEQLREILDYH